MNADNDTSDDDCLVSEFLLSNIKKHTIVCVFDRLTPSF